MRRGIPEADAEDVAARAYEKASRHYTPARGAFRALLWRAADNEAIDWWRRSRRLVHGVDPDPPAPRSDVAARLRADANQRALLERLTPDERAVFGTWALQRHLPQGTLAAADAAAQLSMTVPEYNNAKRRLRRRVVAILGELGLTPRDLYALQDDEAPRRNRAN